MFQTSNYEPLFSDHCVLSEKTFDDPLYKMISEILDETFCVEIKKVIYNKPATIVLWDDGTKTVVKCDEHDTYDPEKGLLIAILKKIYGNKGSFYKDIVMPWLPEKEKL